MSAASESGGVVISATRDSFAAPTPTLQNSPPPPPPAPPLSLSPHNFSFSYSSATDGTNAYKPPVSASSPPYQAAGANPSPGGEAMKRKRGRPRKYGPDASLAMPLVPPATGANVQQPPSPTPPSMKKARGRPPGSAKKQPLEALGSSGIGFTPHVITVKAGEDVSAKIMSFSQHGPRAICILSATGAVSNVTLRQAATSGGTATYEGRFDILSLSGSFLLSEVCGQRSRTGGLSVSLAGPGGRVLGGCVAGLLTAASPVQVIVGSFVSDGCKESKAEGHMESLNAAFNVNPGGVGSGASSSPPSRGTLSESSGGPGTGSPFNQGAGACNNVNPEGIIAWK